MSRKRIEKKPDRARNLAIRAEPGKTADALVAEVAMSPLVPNASTAVDYSKGLFPDLSLNDCVEVLKGHVQNVNAGNLSGAEATLTAQAAALDAVFNNLAKRAIHAEYMDNLDRYLRLALKAQNQCRTTLETLAYIKNPPTAFIRQQNVAVNQQVNNSDHSDRTRAGDSKNQPNKVLEHQHGERLDFGTAGTASSADSAMETVGAIHRPQDSGG